MINRLDECNDIDRRICKPPRLPPDVFCNIHHLPDPIPDGDKYKDFGEVYGSQTSEKHCPSLSSPGAKTRGMPFPPSAQYAKNVKVVLQCGECLNGGSYTASTLSKGTNEKN